MIAFVSVVLLTNLGFQAPPEQPITPELRGDIMMAYKRYRDALDFYKPEAEKSAQAANKAGIAYQQLQDLDNARKYYQRAVKLDPKFAQAMNNLGTIYYTQKSYRRAISEYRKALRIEPDSAPFLSNLGTAYFARKDFKHAYEAYAQAVEIDPQIFDTHGNFGTTVQDQSVEDRAMQHYYMARIFAKNGVRDRAIEYIRKALEEGFKDKDKFLKEPEFATLKNDPEFKLIMAQEQRVL